MLQLVQVGRSEVLEILSRAQTAFLGQECPPVQIVSGLVVVTFHDLLRRTWLSCISGRSERMWISPGVIFWLLELDEGLVRRP